MIIKYDCDRKYIESMQKDILLFENNRISIGELIGRIEIFYRAITYLDPIWRKNFFEKWEALEIEYASALNENRSEFDSDEINIITDAINKMKILIKNALDCYLKTYNPSITKTAEILDDTWLMCPDCIDAWESISQDAIVICPMCDESFHNPRYILQITQPPQLTMHCTEYFYENNTLKLVIEEDIIGVYLIVYKGFLKERSTEDYLLESIEEAFQVANEKFGVSKEKWKKRIKSI